MFIFFFFISANNQSQQKNTKREKRFIRYTHIGIVCCFLFMLCDDVSWLDTDLMISDISFIIMYDLRHCVLLGVFNN